VMNARRKGNVSLRKERDCFIITGFFSTGDNSFAFWPVFWYK